MIPYRHPPRGKGRKTIARERNSALLDFLHSIIADPDAGTYAKLDAAAMIERLEGR